MSVGYVLKLIIVWIKHNKLLLQIRDYLPEKDFKGVVTVLAKMLNFMKMTSMGTVGSNRGIKVSIGQSNIYLSSIFDIWVNPYGFATDIACILH